MYQVQASPEIGLRARSVAMTSWIGCAIPLFRTQILAAVGGIKKISCQIVFLIYADAIICDMLKLPRCFVVMV